VWGLWHPDYKTRHQNTIKLNPIQEELFIKWELMKEELSKDGGYDAVLLLGDLADGLNKKQFGRERMVSDLNEQVGVIEKLLKPICKNKDTIGISGSNYHGSADYEIDKKICKELKGHYGGSVCNIRLKNTNKIINIAHGSGSAPVYSGTKMSKEILQALSSERLMKVPEAHILIRAHHHTYAHFEMLGKHIVWNPSWEGPRLNSYSAPHYYRFQPDIGCTKIEISEDEINVKPFLYQIEYERKNIKVI